MSTDQKQYFRINLTPSGPVLAGTPSARLGQVNLPVPLQTEQDVFAEWQWDGSQIVVRNCRLGFYPIFYYATNTVFGVASSVEALLECGAPQDLDDSAMAVFLRLGWVLGEDTVFKSIRMLPPGGEVRWSGGLPQVSGGINFPKRQSLSREAAIAGYGELFRQSIRRRASKAIPFGMPLSGGRDSRHILLELNAIGCRPDLCFTNHDFPPYREENIRLGKELAHRLGIPHRVFGQPGSRLLAEISKNRLNSYGAIENIWCVNLYPLVARYAPVVYEGIAGDVLSAGDYLNKEDVTLFEQGRLAELASKLIDHWLSWRSSEDALSRILTDGAEKRFTRELAVERIARELSRHTSAANPMTSFYFWNRTRRVAALQPFAIAPASGVTAITPYLDHDLVDFLNSLPAEMYLDQTFHTETIRKMHPEFNDIPYAGDIETPRIESNWHYRRFLFEASAYIAVAGHGHLIDRFQNARRLLALAVSHGNLRKRMTWMAPFTSVYLAQLESTISRSRSKS